jgi:hypothetical protein
MLGCDKSKVSRIETGERGIRDQDLGDLLAVYGAGDGERAVLLALARQPGGWQDAYTGVLPPAVADYLALEAAASQVLVYEGERIPARAAGRSPCWQPARRRRCTWKST